MGKTRKNSQTTPRGIYGVSRPGKKIIITQQLFNSYREKNANDYHYLAHNKRLSLDVNNRYFAVRWTLHSAPHRFWDYWLSFIVQRNEHCKLCNTLRGTPIFPWRVSISVTIFWNVSMTGKMIPISSVYGFGNGK